MVTRKECIDQFANTYFDSEIRHKYISILQDSSIALCEHVFNKAGAPYWFTDHGPEHSDKVFSYAFQIAHTITPQSRRLTAIEALALASASYVHDIAMPHIPSECGLGNGFTKEVIDKVRKRHVSDIHKYLERYTNGYLGKLYRIAPELEIVLPLICKAHGTDEHESACTQLRDACPEDIRGDLLGKILLIADELDITSSRSLIEETATWDMLPEEAQAHQFKHYYVVQLDIDRFPEVKASFIFPEELPQEARSAFTQWIYGKFRQQSELVSRDLSGRVAKVLKIEPIPADTRENPNKKTPAVAVIDYVKKQAQKVAPTKDTEMYSERIARPHSWYETPKTSTLREFSDVLGKLVEEFYSRNDGAIAHELYSKLYVKTEQNLKTADALLAAFESHIAKARKRVNLHSQKPLVITGPPGCGKSSLIMYLAHKPEKALRTRTEPVDQAQIVIHLDCINLGSVEEVLCELLSKLRRECIADPILYERLDADGWLEKLKAINLIDMKQKDLRKKIFRGVMETLYGKTSKNNSVIPVCCVFDNLDRVSNPKTRKKTVKIFSKESCGRGYPFIVFPLRASTKAEVDRGADVFSALPDQKVEAANLDEVLRARLKVAFSKEILDGAESWASRQKVTTMLESFKLTFDDLRQALKSAIKRLAFPRQPQEEIPPLIPGLAGTNMRNALNVYRAIMKSISPTTLLKIKSSDGSCEHELIQCLMEEGNNSYDSSVSKITNIFEPVRGQYYLLRAYCLELLKMEQGDQSDRSLVLFKNWQKRAESCGIGSSLFLETAWSLMTYALALVEIGSYDCVLPDGKFQHATDLKPDTEVQLSSAGKFFLDWLMYDSAYLSCVLQDTPVPYALKPVLGFRANDQRTRTQQVDAFLDFLERKETSERDVLEGSQFLSPLIPRIRRRFEWQKLKTLEK